MRPTFGRLEKLPERVFLSGKIFDVILLCRFFSAYIDRLQGGYARIIESNFDRQKTTFPQWLQQAGIDERGFPHPGFGKQDHQIFG